MELDRKKYRFSIFGKFEHKNWIVFLTNQWITFTLGNTKTTTLNTNSEKKNHTILKIISKVLSMKKEKRTIGVKTESVILWVIHLMQTEWKLQMSHKQLKIFFVSNWKQHNELRTRQLIITW